MKKRNKKGRLALIKAVVFAVIAAGFFIALLSLPVWKIVRIYVEGNRIVSSDLIKDKAEIPMDENIFFLDYAGISKRLREIPQIKNVQVSGRLPSSVLITVEEREPFAVAAVRGRYIVFDSEGFIMESMGPQDVASSTSKIRVFELPTVVGLPERSVVENKRIDPQTMKAIAFSFKTLGRIMSKSKFELDLISFNEMNMIIDDLLKVKIGSPDDIERKFFNLSKILQNIPERSSIEYIDLRAKDTAAVKFKNKP